jgi:hypothetical protein
MLQLFVKSTVAQRSSTWVLRLTFVPNSSWAFCEGLHAEQAQKLKRMLSEKVKESWEHRNAGLEKSK